MNTRTTKRATTTAVRNRRSEHVLIALTTTILALVLGVVTVKAQDAALQDAMARGWDTYEGQPLRVNVWHDRDDEDVYRRGESVRLHFETNHDAYAVVYRIDVEGEVSILWPRSRYDDGFVFANHTYNLPTPGARRVRAGGEEGIEYVQAIVSAYPFDLRQLDVDFHHENENEARRYFVAGDPFLAMNDVNFEITRLENAEDFVVTNYVSWYVGERVAHPRYLCGQCHDDDRATSPYREACTIEIHYDYGWDNDWYGHHGYYPVYYYPVYYYVDPWTHRPWINYWYRPWYSWPRLHVGWSWGWDCYSWHHSPYWHGDVWTRYQGGGRRHRPIDRGVRYKTAKGEYNHPRGLVKDKPSRSERDALTARQPIRDAVRGGADGERLVRPNPTRYADVKRIKRKPQELPRPALGTSQGGIRVPSTRYPTTTGAATVRDGADRPIRTRPSGGGGVRSGSTRGDRSDESLVRPQTGTRGNDGPRVRPVEPRNQGSRIWNGGRSGSGDGGTRAVKPRSGSGSSGAGTRAVKPRSGSGSSGSGSRAVKPRSGSGSSGSSTRAVKPQSRGSSSSSKGSTVKPRSSRGSSSRSKGSSNSSSSRGGSSKSGSSKGGSSKRGGGSSKRR